MSGDFALQQSYWLFLLPLPWLWLYWRQQHPAVWPRLFPPVTIRYPLIKELQIFKDSFDENSHTIDKTAKSTYGAVDFNVALAMTLMIFALSQPVQFKNKLQANNQSQAADLILVVDTALSMSLTDYSISGQAVSRLAMSKLFLNDFINDYSGHQLALVLLANPPALWLPFTHDKAVVLNAVNRISTLLGGRISDMGATLNLLEEQFQDDREKVVLLISDGGTQIGAMAPDTAARQLVKKGFTLYVLAMGTSEADADLVNNSSLIYQVVNLQTLQKLADSGAGQLFHVLNAQAFKDVLASILTTIESKHSHTINEQTHKRLSHVWYPLPLFIGMLLLLYSALTNPQYRFIKRLWGRLG